VSEAFADHTLLAEEDGVIPDPKAPWRWIVARWTARTCHPAA
jgi:myo-inositol-1(or 4)-monophosphatase